MTNRSIADCKEAIGFDPNLASAYNNRSFAHLNKGDFGKAIADCNEASRSIQMKKEVENARE